MSSPGAVAAGDRVGAFAGSHARSEGGGAFAGDASMQRGGSFADVDRDLVTEYRDGVAHMRVAGHRDLRGLLESAGLDRATAERDVAELHRGRVVVLVEAPDEAAARTCWTRRRAPNCGRVGSGSDRRAVPQGPRGAGTGSTLGCVQFDSP